MPDERDKLIAERVIDACVYEIDSAPAMTKTRALVALRSVVRQIPAILANIPAPAPLREPSRDYGRRVARAILTAIAEGFLTHPSVLLEEELEVRGWTHRDMAGHMGGDPAIDELALDFYAASHHPQARLGTLAEGIGRAFGTGAEFWTNMEQAWLRKIDEIADAVPLQPPTDAPAAEVK